MVSHFREFGAQDCLYHFKHLILSKFSLYIEISHEIQASAFIFEKFGLYWMSLQRLTWKIKTVRTDLPLLSIFPFFCSKHPPHNRLAQRKTHFLPEAAKILIKTQRSVQRLPRCMSSNGNTWGRQGGRSAACNSLTEGEESRRARGDRGFHKGQREYKRGIDRQKERWSEGTRCVETGCTDTSTSERSGTKKIKERSLPLTTHFVLLKITSCKT